MMSKRLYENEVQYDWSENTFELSPLTKMPQVSPEYSWEVCFESPTDERYSSSTLTVKLWMHFEKRFGVASKVIAQENISYNAHELTGEAKQNAVIEIACGVLNNHYAKIKLDLLDSQLHELETRYPSDKLNINTLKSKINKDLQTLDHFSSSYEGKEYFWSGWSWSNFELDSKTNMPVLDEGYYWSVKAKVLSKAQVQIKVSLCKEVKHPRSWTMNGHVISELVTNSKNVKTIDDARELVLHNACQILSRGYHSSDCVQNH